MSDNADNPDAQIEAEHAAHFATNLAANFGSVAQRIKAASAATEDGHAGTNKPVQLIAVSKGHPRDAVLAAMAAGQRVFGENRVQEAKAKFADLRPLYPDLCLHLIGALQTNKADEAVQLFDVIETLDRPHLAHALAQAIAKATTKTIATAKHIPSFYIEINIGGEAQKSGISPTDLPAFLKICRSECGLDVTGLMCIPPKAHEPWPYFHHLKQLADCHQLAHISMGMSADFEEAIQCGATEVRIGTALFGSRTRSNS
jgi:pyridoxal phosphate enzyme (YggS family)